MRLSSVFPHFGKLEVLQTIPGRDKSQPINTGFIVHIENDATQPDFDRFADLMPDGYKGNSAELKIELTDDLKGFKILRLMGWRSPKSPPQRDFMTRVKEKPELLEKLQTLFLEIGLRLKTPSIDQQIFFLNSYQVPYFTELTVRDFYQIAGERLAHHNNEDVNK